MGRSLTTFRPGKQKTGGRRKGILNRVTLAVREAARQLVEDAEYRKQLRRRLIQGEAGPLEPLLWHYAYGRPVDRVEYDIGEDVPQRVRWDFSTLTLDEKKTLANLWRRALSPAPETGVRQAGTSTLQPIESRRILNVRAVIRQ